jgi:hypothetical protein
MVQEICSQDSGPSDYQNVVFCFDSLSRHAVRPGWQVKLRLRRICEAGLLTSCLRKRINAHVYLSVESASGCTHQVSTWSVSSVSGNVFIRPDAALLARSHSKVLN